MGWTYVGRLCVSLQVGFDGFVLLVEVGQVWDEVFDDVGVRKWVDAGLFSGVGWDPACLSSVYW